MHELPPPVQGRGRPRRYGARTLSPQEWLHVRGGWLSTTIVGRGRQIPLRYRVAGPSLRPGAADQPLFLLVVKGIDQASRHHHRRRAPSVFLVNAVNAGPEEGH